MSANNFLWIRKEKYWWAVSDVDLDSGKHRQVGQANTLEVAIRKANDYKLGTEVEYGLEIDLPKGRRSDD